MKITIPGLRKKRIDFNGGLDEYSPVTDVPLSDAIEMTNFRLTRDGKRIMKRHGTWSEVTDFAEDVYGYTTYYDEDDAYCQLVVLESQIKRKVAAGSWTSIHSFSSNISHPVKILSVQGKQFIINETDSRMIHTDKADYQIGITNTRPATALGYTAGGSAGNLSAGDYRYAVTFARSGNYGCESNPHYSFLPTTPSKSPVGLPGLTDLTYTGTYTGTTDIASFQVVIDGTGTPDTFKYSFDAGTTWDAETVPMASKNYLSRGIEANWGATTGHALNDVYSIAIKAYKVTATAGQSVTLTDIPVSSDAQVDQRKIYRTLANGARYYWLATIDDNTVTTYKDGHPDSYLGSRMGEDKDILPNCKFAEWWDDRLWVLDATNNIAYYSEIDYPEEFDTDVRFITFRQQFADDECTGMIAYKDALYIFKRKAIYIVLKQPGGTYGRYLITCDVGCVAPWSIVEANNTLMFLSYRGWEQFNGYETTPMRLSVQVSRTLDTIIQGVHDKITSIHASQYNEVWLSIPNHGAYESVTIVYNYVSKKFYLFSWLGFTPSCFMECRNSTKALVIKMGTPDGYLNLCESGYADMAYAITATIRKPWIETEMYGNIRYLETEYELPASMTLTMNIYNNFDKDVARTASLTGVTPTSTDREIRRPIRDVTELGQRAKYFCVEYTNAQNLGGDLKINKAYIYYAPTTMKGKVSGD